LFEIWYNTNRHRDGRHLAENRTFSYQQIHAHKPLFGNQGKKGKVLNLGHLDFDIVSDFVLRISYFSYRDTNFCPLHLSRTLYKSALFMQNEPNFQKSQMNVSIFSQKAYENKSNWTLGENEPNTNPIRTQTNPIKANKMPKQTQNEPNQTQFQT